MEFAGLPNWNRPLSLENGTPSSIAIPQNYLNPFSQLHNRASSLIVIDPTVPNYQQLVAGIQANTNVLILDPAQDAIAQITQALLGRTGISSLHLVSHGASGAIQLGGTWLDRAALDRYQSDFQQWAKALTEDADILIYGCDVAAGDAGRSFINQFSQLTGADIAASDDLTGNAALSGDWALEVNTGAIGAQIAFTAEARSNYQAILPVDLISVGNPTLVKGSVGLEDIQRNSVSGDGRYVVFTSRATLSANDANGATDVFLYDRQADTVTLVSRNATSTGSASGTSLNPVISYDSNYVAFVSNANDLVGSMTSNTSQANNIFVWERSTGNLALVSRAADGKSGLLDSSAPSISDDGSRIAFQTQSPLLDSDTNFDADVYVWSRSANALTHISRRRANTFSLVEGAESPVISGDGSYVAFTSLAANLTFGDLNGSQDIFLWQQSDDTVYNLTINAQVAGNADSRDPVISRDGSRVAFTSDSNNFATDTNRVADVFVWTRSGFNEFNAPQGNIQLVSVNSAGNNSGNSAGDFGSNSGSQKPVISRNGEAIAFTSSSTDLVDGDTNGKIDVFVRNLVSNQTVLVSRGENGIGNGDSGNQSLSADGTRVAFTSVSTNLATGDTNAQQDVFVRDISTGRPDSGKTFLISRTPTGGVGNNISGTTSSGIFAATSVPVISGDGNIVAFVSLAQDLTAEDTNALFDGFVVPVTTGNATLMSRRSDSPDLVSRTGSGDSTIASNSMSADGRYIVFTSAAPEVVDGDTNGVSDVFLRDRQTGTTTLISKGAAIANGASGNAMISADGRYIVFTSAASNLASGDNNNAVDIFWVDRQTSQLRLVSRAVGGATSADAESLNPVLSANGLFVAFTSTASNLVNIDTNTRQDVFVWNSQDNSITIVSRSNAESDGASDQPVISADGRYVAFVSAATNLASSDTNAQRDVFVWDQQTGAVTLVSRATGVNGAISDGDSYQVSISQDGRTIAFTSTATNLAGTLDADSDEDVFVRNLDTNTTTHASVNRSGGYSVSQEFTPLKASNAMMSGDGKFVVFTSSFEDLVDIAANGVSDVFRRNLTTGVTELVSVNKDGTGSGNNTSGAEDGTGIGSGRGWFYPMLSNDGRLVIFSSFSSNLADGDTNNASDVFVRDMNSGFTTLVSRIPSETNSGRGASFNSVLSGNGNYIAFNSLATDLTPRDLNSSVDVFGLNLETTVSLTVDKTTIAESTPAGTVQYKIRRNRTDGDLTVKLAIDASSTATNGDYTLTADPSLNLTRNGSEITVKLPNGTAEGIITLNVSDDTEIETEETFNLNLIAAPEYAIADSFETTSLKITDNDIPILVSISDITTDKAEGNAGEKEFTFQVTLSAPATTAPVTVKYATQPGTADANDFLAVSDTLTFNVGDPDTKTITVRVKGDTQFEPSETFSVVLSEPSANARLATSSSATATIENDDTAPTITIAGANAITEGDTGTQTYTFTVSLSEASSTEVKVNYAVRDLTTVSGTDYVAIPAGTLTFAPGVTTQTIAVSINGDRLYEGDEQFQIELSNPVEAILPDEQKLKTGTITDNDPAPRITIEAAPQQTEGTSPYNFVVKLSEASGRPVTVKYDTIAGSATAGEDFTAASNTLTFATGETEKTIAIPVLSDTRREQNETFSVKLTDATDATITTDTATATIVDDDPIPTVSITSVSQAEGNSGDTPLQFTVTLSNASDQEIVLNYATKDETASASDNDYQSNSGSIRFAPGTTSQTITVNAKGDTRRERDETFSIELSSTTPNLVTIPITAIGVGTIQNDDTTLPTISVSPATVSEGGVLSFTVSLSDTSSDEIRVNFATSDGTATQADSDYTQRTSETLVFASGEQTKTVTVQTTNDNKLEDDETLALTLTNPVNATLDGTGTAIGTIKNDDQRPTIGIASTPLSEDNPQAAAYPFTIRLSNPTTQTVTVKYRTIDDTATVGDNDYVSAQGTVTFNPGEVEKTITVTANSDRKFEPTERFIVRLEDAVNADLATSATDGYGTLNNDDAAPQLSIVSRTGTRTEGNSGKTPFEFVVSLNNPSSQEIRVNFATSNGTATSGSDYETTNGTLIFAPGEEQKTITVNVLGDTVLEPEETFFVELSTPTNATISGSNTAQGTILNDDQAIRPTIQIEDVITSEGSADTTYTFKVKLSEATTNQVTVQYRTDDGTATIADNDYIGVTQPQTLTFAPGEVEKQFSVVVRGDTKFEPNETFFAQLLNPTNADLSSVSRARGVINNDDARPTISIGNVVVSEGNDAFTNATFTVSLSNSSSEPIKVNYTTVDGTARADDNDYETAAGELTFAPGVTSQQITVRVRGDRKFELNESFSIQLSSPTGADLFTAPNQGVGTILADDFRPMISIDDATPVLEGNTGATPVRFTVRLSNPSSEVVTTKYITKNGTTNDADYAGVTTPTTVTFAPGQTEQTITVQAIGDSVYELDEAFTVELSDPTNAQITDGSATAIVRNDDPLPKLSIATVPVSKPEGNGGITPFTFEISLSEASPTPITVNYTTLDETATIANNDYAKASDTLTFAPGETKKTITVNVLGDALFEGNETFQVSLSNPSGATIQTNVATATIAEDDTPPTLNNNSPFDVLWRNRLTGQNLLWQPAGTLLDRELSLATIPDPRWTVAGTADFNGDGSGDLLWRNSTTGENAIWCMNADLIVQGSFLPTIDGAWQVAGIGDFNRDRKADILWRNSQTGENAIWFMRDTVVNSGTFIFKVSEPSWKVSQIADFNNDGSSDIVWANSSTGEVAIWLMDGATIKESRLEQVSDLAWRIAATGDINRDGFVDLLWRNDRTGQNAMWLMRNGQVERGAFLPSVAPTNWQVESLFDFNGDRSLDILWHNGTTQETVIWFLNEDKVGITTYLPNLPDRNWSIQAVDQFSNQSKGEILLRNSQTGENRIWRISLDWFDRTTVLDPQIDRDWEIQGTADFDRNGSADILWRNLRTRELSVWLTQNGQVQNKVTVPDGLGISIDWMIEGIGDFSGDGSPDIIWRNRRNGQTAMWLFNGTQVASGLFLPTIDPNWRIGGVADMNADLNLDLVWRNTTTNEVAIWLLNRTDITRGILLPTVDTNWQIKGFADFNRDGQTDIIWRNSSTAETALWFMNGTQVSRALFLPIAASSWDIVGVGDFNRDNQSDLLWRDRGTGSNAVWYLVNGSVTFATYVPSLTDLGWQLESIDDF